ncbi:hypothetical protein FDECE_12047 [Fusarium decemcellulare]|nr:hypothetical protein FDECE_12047 [Fusarium decemcellulare]
MRTHCATGFSSFSYGGLWRACTQLSTTKAPAGAAGSTKKSGSGVYLREARRAKLKANIAKRKANITAGPNAGKKAKKSGDGGGDGDGAPYMVFLAAALSASMAAMPVSPGMLSLAYLRSVKLILCCSPRAIAPLARRYVAAEATLDDATIPTTDKRHKDAAKFKACLKPAIQAMFNLLDEDKDNH